MSNPSEGYPDSPAEELDPGPDQIETLDQADQELAGQHRHEPQGRHAEGSIEDEDARVDAHDADEVAATQSQSHALGGHYPTDIPNFNDNTAEWSRERE